MRPQRSTARSGTATGHDVPPAREVAAEDSVAEVATVERLAAAAGTFDLLSVPSRLHLVWLLATGEHDVSTLAELTGANVPAASQQLAKLRAAGVVAVRRDGRRQLYRVADPHLVHVIAEMFAHIAPDGTLAGPSDPRRPPRLPRFAGADRGHRSPIVAKSVQGGTGRVLASAQSVGDGEGKSRSSTITTG